MSYFLFLKPVILFFMMLSCCPLKPLACEFIAGKPIEHIIKENNVIYFECPSEANAIELCRQEANLRAVACTLDGDLEQFLMEDNFEKGTVSGSEERTHSFLSIKTHHDHPLYCKGHFKHPLSIVLEGESFQFDHSIFTQTDGVILKPRSIKEDYLANYLKLIPVSPLIPIYVQGNADLKNLDFASCEIFNNRCFIVSNAHIEISLNKPAHEK